MTTRQKGAGAELKGRAGQAETVTLPALCWPGFAFDRERVRELGVAAYCWTLDGELWEFEGGGFFVTARGDRGGRRRVDEADAPCEGWSHRADCACIVCRVPVR